MSSNPGANTLATSSNSKLKNSKKKLTLEEFCKVTGIETPELEQSKKQEEEIVYIVDNSSSSKKKKALKQGDKTKYTSRNTKEISVIHDDFEGDFLFDYHDIGDDEYSDEDNDVVL